MDYQDWICEWLKKNNPYGQCRQAVDEMAKAFPELMKVPGWAWCAWGQRDHWWLETPEGEIIDPTATQFPGGVARYEKWTPGAPVRVGRCMNCGDDIWECVDTLDGGSAKCICSPDCEQEFLTYLGQG